MAGVFLASGQSLLCFWVYLAPFPQYPGPRSALLGRDRLMQHRKDRTGENRDPRVLLKLLGPLEGKREEGWETDEQPS